MNNKYLLICVTGNVRTFNVLLNPFIKWLEYMFGLGYNIDLYFSSYNEKYNYHSFIKNDLDFYDEEIIDSKYFDCISEIIKYRLIKTIDKIDEKLTINIIKMNTY